MASPRASPARLQHNKGVTVYALIIKNVAKISIIQTLMSNLCVKTIVFCYFMQLFRYPTNFARLH